jgi:hypothetical protein
MDTVAQNYICWTSVFTNDAQHNISGCITELVFTKLILQILDWIYAIAIHSRYFILCPNP